jgi:hypothetical protein
MSPTLDGTYMQMLARIKKMYRQEALTLLRWIAYARSPPALGELVDAAITDPNQEDSIDTSERGGLRDVFNILSGLVTVEESQDAYAEDPFAIEPLISNTSTHGPCQSGGMFHTQHLTKDTRVTLAHFSVKEYLESERILGSKANQFRLESTVGHMTLAQSCLTYLRYYSISNEKTSTSQHFEIFLMLNTRLNRGSITRYCNVPRR